MANHFWSRLEQRVPAVGYGIPNIMAAIVRHCAARRRPPRATITRHAPRHAPLACWPVRREFQFWTWKPWTRFAAKRSLEAAPAASLPLSLPSISVTMAATGGAAASGAALDADADQRVPVLILSGWLGGECVTLERRARLEPAVVGSRRARLLGLVVVTVCE